MERLIQVLGTCYNLQVLSADKVFIDGSGPGLVPDVSPTWATRQLKKLRLGIRLQGHPNDDNDMRRVPEGIKEVALSSSSRIAPSFMEQLGYQTRLYDLVLSFNAAYCCGASPFLQLAIGLLNGLDQFEELKRLEYFSCTGILHEVGSSEIAWMKVHWPRLRKIHLPVFDAEDKT
ncbi:hypothetical protein BG005_009295, partial [Podila minutissima]